ncbi:MAG: hypothetical protein ABIT71_20970 [Vicinamibacteraceae bacterium]
MAAFFQKVQHVLPAGALLTQGLARLRDEPHGWSFALGTAELVISVVVVVAFVRQLVAMRQARHGGHAGGAHHTHGIDWVDLFLGAMLVVEVWAHWHESGHIKRPAVLLAVVMLTIGLLHGKIAAFGARRNALRIDDAGIDVGGKPFRRFRATWDQLAAVDITPNRARLVRRDGGVRELNLRDLPNAADVRAALEGIRLRLAPVPAEALPEAASTARPPA